MITLADQILYSSVNLQRIRLGTEIGSGTGFFWTIPLINKEELTVIVTNRHVVLGCDELVAICHERDLASTEVPNGSFVPCALVTAGSIIEHPDPSVDLCAIPFGPTLNHAISRGRPLFFRSIVAGNIPTQQEWLSFDSIEDVVMVGCPEGIYDSFNNLPLVRKGITATPLRKDYCGREEFLVDMACYPGSSGSPVYMLSRGHVDRESGAFHLTSSRFYFLGVLYQGPQTLNEGKIVLGKQAKLLVPSMMHLGQVIRSTALMALQREILTFCDSQAREGD